MDASDDEPMRFSLPAGAAEALTDERSLAFISPLARMLAGALEGASDLHDILDRPGARIVDVRCGTGWSAIALALAHTQATFVGADIDAPSVARARTNAEQAGVAPRVTFHRCDASTLAGSIDAAFVFEAAHDMS